MAGRKPKKVSAKELERVINGYCQRKFTQGEAAKELKVSTPTFIMWINAVYMNGWIINDNLPFVYWD